MLSLLVQVHLTNDEDAIKQVSLHPNNTGKLSWQILASDQNSPLYTKIDHWMQLYAIGKQPNIPLPISLDALPEFTHLTLSALRTVPFGKTTTYHALACAVGAPKSARAVGNACGSNPCPLIIPCHRVIKTSGEIGGFSGGGGTSIKAQLLAFEGYVLG